MGVLPSFLQELTDDTAICVTCQDRVTYCGKQGIRMRYTVDDWFSQYYEPGKAWEDYHARMAHWRQEWEKTDD